MNAITEQLNRKFRLRGTEFLARIRSILKRLYQEEYTPRGLALLFLIAALTGFGIKSLVHERWTIGFDDYRVKEKSAVIDLNLLQKNLIDQGGSFATNNRTIPRGPSCVEGQE